MLITILSCGVVSVPKVNYHLLCGVTCVLSATYHPSDKVISGLNVNYRPSEVLISSEQKKHYLRWKRFSSGGLRPAEGTEYAAANFYLSDLIIYLQSVPYHIGLSPRFNAENPSVFLNANLYISFIRFLKLILSLFCWYVPENRNL